MTITVTILMYSMTFRWSFHMFSMTFREVAHPGVITSSHDNEEERRYVTYYQWVGFTLFFQVQKIC